MIHLTAAADVIVIVALTFLTISVGPVWRKNRASCSIGMARWLRANSSPCAGGPPPAVVAHPPLLPAFAADQAICLPVTLRLAGPTGDRPLKGVRMQVRHSRQQGTGHAFRAVAICACRDRPDRSPSGDFDGVIALPAIGRQRIGGKESHEQSTPTKSAVLSGAYAISHFVVDVPWMSPSYRFETRASVSFENSPRLAKDWTSSRGTQRLKL